MLAIRYNQNQWLKCARVHSIQLLLSHSFKCIQNVLIHLNCFNCHQISHLASLFVSLHQSISLCPKKFHTHSIALNPSRKGSIALMALRICSEKFKKHKCPMLYLHSLAIGFHVPMDLRGANSATSWKIVFGKT